jgi:GntR family transcriptional repressor for pyruvate dehydrogenase complex
VSIAPSSDRVADLIEQQIAALALGPDDRVGTEEEIARELDVSRAAVREAVRLLARSHRVRAVRGPGGGVFVARTADRGLAQTVTGAITSMLATGSTSLAELTEVRVLLEVPIAGLAAKRATSDTLAQLRRAVGEAERHPEDEIVQRESDVRFHRTIAQAARNQIACALVAWSHELLQPQLKDLIGPAIVEAVARDQHREIVKAIASGKPALAEAAMHDHLRYLGDLLETVAPPPS